MKRFLPLLFLSLAIALFCGASSCGDDPPPKPEPPTAKPDTSTHQYDWEAILVKGNTGLVEFFDVWAFSPENVWAVGNIQDVGYPDSVRPNVYHWDGSKWNFKSIPMRMIGSADTGKPTWHDGISAIWGFSPNNLFFTSELQTHAYSHVRISNLDTTAETHLLVQYGGGQGRIWAIDSNNIFMAGFRADALIYDGKTFRAINTNLANFSGAIIDLWASGPDNIIACVDAFNYPTSPYYLLKFNGSLWEKKWTIDENTSMSDSVFFGAPRAVWGVPGEDSVYISGLWLGRMKNDGSGKVTPVVDLRSSGGSIRRIRGTNKNNVFFVGHEGNIMHYNGVSFFQYKNFLGRQYFLSGISVLERDVYIVGSTYDSHTGVIIHGKAKY